MIDPRVSYSCIFVLLHIVSCTEKQGPEESDSKPEENRFSPVVVAPPGTLNEPMVFEVLEDESVLIIERGGALKKWSATEATMKTIAHIPVFTHSEQGLVGMTIDPMIGFKIRVDGHAYKALLTVREYVNVCNGLHSGFRGTPLF